MLDSTLREGEQTPGVFFTIEQKLNLAKKLDLFGIDFIEIGHPAVAPDIYEAVEALNSLDLKAKKIVQTKWSNSFQKNCTIQLFSSLKKQGVEEADTIIQSWLTLNKNHIPNLVP